MKQKGCRRIHLRSELSARLRNNNSAITSHVTRTNQMLNNDFDGPQRHVSTGDLIGRSCPPFVGRNRLQKMFYCRQELHRIQLLFLEILRDIPRKLPHAFQNKFSNPRVFRLGWRAGARERLDDLQEEGKQRTSGVFSTYWSY